MGELPGALWGPGSWGTLTQVSSLLPPKAARLGRTGVGRGPLPAPQGAGVFRGFHPSGRRAPVPGPRAKGSKTVRSLCCPALRSGGNGVHLSPTHKFGPLSSEEVERLQGASVPRAPGGRWAPLPCNCGGRRAGRGTRARLQHRKFTRPSEKNKDEVGNRKMLRERG